MLKQKAKVTVLKFGSSVLRSEADLPSAVHEIYRHWREGAQVIAVVSAFGDTTDQLMRRAESVCAQPDKSVRDVCGIPDRYEVVALLPLGRPRGNWGVAPRRPAPAITNWNGPSRA